MKYMLRSRFGKEVDDWTKEHDFVLKPIQLIESIPSFEIVNENNYTFLNLPHKFEDQIDWNFNEFGKLWTYNLNYFEWLQQDSLNPDDGLKSIDQYIDNLSLLKDGLEPFPISLRLLNWMKFVIPNKINSSKINNAIFNQAHRLENNIEYHLLGNHLLENFFTLVCFSVFTSDNVKFDKYSVLLLEQLDEQILDDGGHFELSPMYHQIMLNRLLDTINFIKGSTFNGAKIQVELKSKAERMLMWLKNMTFKSGDIPLFNDSAFKIAPSTEEITEYASRLNIKTDKKKKLSDSGYRSIFLDNMELLLDVGEIGPDYIPGHAHSDMLSFEMQYNGKAFIVDTGLSTYEIGEDRNRERATASHNTVVVNGQNQSQVWGGFRVAKRARMRIESETNDEIIASHDGYNSLGTNTKRIFRNLKSGIEIRDVLSATKGGNNKSFFHFHPSVKIELINNICKTNLGTLEFKNASKIEMQSYLYAPEFNNRVEATKLVVSFEKELIINIH